ncbi:hypothetical protein [Sphingomonas sp.]|uniref:hypothetical protein n=1 Tax=Sphingomonas sp. TaxID=28214 RepID=UPI00261EA188|nr:hypothetical protein [Sphingomonas sp.]MDF2494573.1 hypothetical protein [Sphingomonas sp.]
MKTLKLKEVFTPGGQPSITYVSREHLGLEKRVKDALSRGYSINVVTGSTKSGKTVLCNHVLDQTGDSVTIEGGQVKSEEDFWEQIAYTLEVGSQRSRKVAGTGTATDEAVLEGSIPGVKASVRSGSAQGKTHERSVTYTINTQRAALDSLVERDVSLLVDDFHYIDKSVQRAIIRALKGAVFKGLAVILLAVPHRAFDPMTVEQELEGRFKHVEIPPWDLDDLLQIPSRGFDALNVTNDPGLNKKICEEGFGNPLLVQEICSELCIASGISSRAVVKQEIVVGELDAALAEIAKSKGFPKYSKLRQGPDAKKKRMLREFKDGRSQDKYSAILTALAALGPQQRTEYEDLRVALQGLLKPGSMPAKHEITSALSNMSKVAREKIEGEPPLEWVESEDALIITDPFLLFYMKWATDHLAPGASA